MSVELFTKEKKAEFTQALSAQAFADIVAKTKAADGADSGTFRMIISSANQDRQGDKVNQDGFNTDHYMKNAVVLWGHDYYSMPVGITDKLVKENGMMVAYGRFAPTPEAQKLRQYYDQGFPIAASIGYIELDGEGENVKSIELLEWSFVPVPANGDCIPLPKAVQLGLDVAFLQTKGIRFDNIQTKDAEIGASCNMDDGTLGVLAADPNDPKGALVCVPIEKMAKKESVDPMNDELDQHLRDDIKAEHDMHQEMAKSILTKCFKNIEEAKGYKGAVQDQLDEEAANNEKYAKLDNAWDVFYAFTSAYLDETTPVGDFEKLLDEAVELMKGTIGESKAYIQKHPVKAVTEDHAAKCMKEMKVEHGRHAKAIQESIEEYMTKAAKPEDGADEGDEDEGGGGADNGKKSGASISAANKAKLKEIHEHTKAIEEHTKAQGDVIEGMMNANDDGEGEDDGKKAIKTSEERSEDIKTDEQVKEYLKKTQIVKSALKSAIDNAIGSITEIKKAEKRIKSK